MKLSKLFGAARTAGGKPGSTPGFLAIFRKMKQDPDHKAQSPVIETVNDGFAGLDDRDDSDEKGSAFRSSIVQLLCGIYGMIIVVLGLVLPTSKALADMAKTIPYYVESNQAFHIYVYLVALLFLAYLHGYLLRQKPGRMRKRNNRHMMNHKGQNEKGTFQEVTDNCQSKDTTPSREEASDFYQTSPPVSHDAEGVNFYLRLGAIGFGAGSMIHDGFRIAQVFETGNTLRCYGPLYLVVATMHLFFVFVQTFFLFKNHKIVINKHKALVRFGLMHIVATNLCVWSLTVVSETSDDYQHSRALKDLVSNSTAEPPNANSRICYELDTLARRAAPYLYPSSIEYSIIAAAVVYRIYKNVGRAIKGIADPMGEIPAATADCHKANKGFFMGLFISVMTLIAISSYFIFDEKLARISTAAVIFYVLEMSLLLVACVVVVIGFIRLHQLLFNLDEVDSFNGMLLVVGLVGLCVYDMFVIISSTANVTKQGHVSVLSLCSSLMALIQASVQTIFVLDGLRRCAATDDHVFQKPGRALVTFLLLCNLSLWIVNIFEVKKVETSSLHVAYYGYLPWSIISHICVPLMIFFRFHSSICMSEIWVYAYVIKNRDM